MQTNGPSDCDYSLGFDGCTSACSMARLSNWQTKSMLLQEGCLQAVNGVQQYHSCSPQCSQLLQNLQTSCAKCTAHDPFMRNFLASAATFNSKCATASVVCSKVPKKIEAACCPSASRTNHSCSALAAVWIPTKAEACQGTCKKEIDAQYASCQQYFLNREATAPVRPPCLS